MVKPMNKNKKIKEILTYLSIIFVIAEFITLHGAVIMQEIRDDSYLRAIYYGMMDILQGNIAIFPITIISIKYTFFTVLVLVVVGIVWMSDFLFKKDMMDNTQDGSADWNTDFDTYNKTYSAPIGSTKNNGPENMILSNEVRLSMEDFKTRRNNNILVVGGAGTGKSRFICKPNMLQANCSYVITDPSGELLESHGKFFENLGYKVKVFNLIDMTHSNCYNPFHYIRDDLGVMIMINCLIKNTDNGRKGGDPFWEKSETALLQAIIFYLMKYQPKEKQNFNSVLELLSYADVDENNASAESKLDRIFKYVEEDDPNSLAVKQYKIFKQGAGKTLKSILISTMVRISHFNIKELSRLTKTDTLDLQKVGDEKTALFVIIPSADDTYNYLVSMMYSQLFETLYFHAENECGGKKRLNVPVRFLLDEFANIGQIPNFEKKLATMRKYGISCTIILQSLSQIKSLYKDDYQGIIGNCDSFILLGTNDEETAKYVSDKLGTKTIRTQSISRTNKSGKRGNTSNARKGRKLMLPEEIMEMDNSKCIVTIRGEKPFFTDKYILENHHNFRLSADYDKSLGFDLNNNPDYLIKDTISYKDIKKQIMRADKESRLIGPIYNIKEGNIQELLSKINKEREKTEKYKQTSGSINTNDNTEGDIRSIEEEAKKTKLGPVNYEFSEEDMKNKRNEIEAGDEELNIENMNSEFDMEPDMDDL